MDDSAQLGARNNDYGLQYEANEGLSFPRHLTNDNVYNPTLESTQYQSSMPIRMSIRMRIFSIRWGMVGTVHGG